MITVTSGVLACDGRHPQHGLASAHKGTGPLGRCLDQILSIICPGRVTSKHHSANNHHSWSLWLQEAPCP